MFKHIALVLTVSLLPLAAGAEVYRWVDAQGRVHYSDRPDSRGAQRVGIESKPTNPEAVAQRNEAAKTQREQTETAAKKQNADTAAAKAVEKDATKLRAERCEKAKQDYKVAMESRQLYRLGADGERQYLTSAEIDTARINARKAMDEACQPQG